MRKGEGEHDIRLLQGEGKEGRESKGREKVGEEGRGRAGNKIFLG